MKNYFNQYGGIPGIIDRFTDKALIYKAMQVFKMAKNGQMSHAPIVLYMATLAQFGRNIFMYPPGYLIIMKEAANNDNNAIKVINLITISHWKVYGRCTFT